MFMTNIAKLLVGAGAASLLAWGAHATSAERFVGNLHDGTATALKGAGLEGIDIVPAGTEGYFSRIISLSGEGVDAETRAKAEAAIAAGVPNAARVVWVGGNSDDGSAAAGAGDGAGDNAVSEAAVATCQDDVNTVVAAKEINFKMGSAYMPDSSLAVVKEVAEALKPCDGVALAVGGHTDATGSDDVNQTLSQARADAVKAALVENGLSADSITATGFGSSKPKVEGAGANEANRRIEFTLGAGGDTAKADAAQEGGE